MPRPQTGRRVGWREARRPRRGPLRRQRWGSEDQGPAPGSAGEALCGGGGAVAAALPQRWTGPSRVQASLCRRQARGAQPSSEAQDHVRQCQRGPGARFRQLQWNTVGRGGPALPYAKGADGSHWWRAVLECCRDLPAPCRWPTGGPEARRGTALGVEVAEGPRTERAGGLRQTAWKSAPRGHTRAARRQQRVLERRKAHTRQLVTEPRRAGAHLAEAHLALLGW